MTLSANWHKDQFLIHRFLWSDFIMNYYEYRLMEIQNAITLYEGRKDLQPVIEELKEERKQILQQLKGEEQ